MAPFLNMHNIKIVPFLNNIVPFFLAWLLH